MKRAHAEILGTRARYPEAERVFNQYTNTTGLMQMGQGSAFTVPYPYKLEDAATVAASVEANAGPK